MTLVMHGRFSVNILLLKFVISLSHNLEQNAANKLILNWFTRQRFHQ